MLYGSSNGDVQGLPICF